LDDIERINTGVSNLDDFIGGGIPRGIDIVLHGEPGCGKTTFAIQFIREGLRNGENCIFVEMDILPRDLRTKMQLLGLDPGQYENSDKLVIIDGVSGKRLGASSNEKFVIKDPRDLNSIAKAISDARQMLGTGGRLVIDSWASIALNFHAEYRGLIRFTEAFIVESRNSNYTTLLITDFSIDDKLMKILRHITSGFIELITKFESNVKRRYIMVHNLPFTFHRETPIPYTLGNAGIRITEGRL
jgi:KaiC/GvpD/RAD55 family RecA-like ATPase